MHTEDTTTSVGPDGLMHFEQAASAVRVRRGDGWVPVDLTLEPTAAGYRPRASTADLLLSAGGTGPVATLVRDGKTVAARWPDPLPAPTIDGHVATYPLSADQQLRVTVTSRGFQLHLVLLRKPKAAPVVRVPLDVTNLTVVDQADGGLTLTDPTGAAQMEMAPPTMWGAARHAITGEPKMQAKVARKLEKRAGGVDLVLAPSATFLDDPAVTYPVVVDPDVAYVTRVRDAYVSSDAQTTAYGTTERLYTGVLTNGTSKYISYLQVATPTLPAGATLMSANLKVFQYNAYSCTPTELRAFPLATAWNTGVTWSTKPDVVAGYSQTASFAYGISGCPDNYANIPVTNMVAGWLSNLPNHGLALYASQTDSNAYKALCSANYTAAASTHPCADGSRGWVFTVAYNRPPTVPTGRAIHPCSADCTLLDEGGAIATSDTPRFSAVSTDADGDLLTYDFEVVELDLEGPVPTTPSVKCPGSPNSPHHVAGAADTEPDWTVPAGSLQPGTAYAFSVRAFDSTACSPWSSWAWFTVVPPPNAPQDIAFTRDGSGAPQLTWTPPELSDGGDVAGFVVTLPDGTSVSTTRPTAALTSATPGTYRVRSLNAGGSGADASFTLDSATIDDTRPTGRWIWHGGNGPEPAQPETPTPDALTRAGFLVDAPPSPPATQTELERRMAYGYTGFLNEGYDSAGSTSTAEPSTAESLDMSDPAAQDQSMDLSGIPADVNTHPESTPWLEGETLETGAASPDPSPEQTTTLASTSPVADDRVMKLITDCPNKAAMGGVGRNTSRYTWCAWGTGGQGYYPNGFIRFRYTLVFDANRTQRDTDVWARIDQFSYQAKYGSTTRIDLWAECKYTTPRSSCYKTETDGTGTTMGTWKSSPGNTRRIARIRSSSGTMTAPLVAHIMAGVSMRILAYAEGDSTHELQDGWFRCDTSSYITTYKSACITGGTPVIIYQLSNWRVNETAMHIYTALNKPWSTMPPADNKRIPSKVSRGPTMWHKEQNRKEAVKQCKLWYGVNYTDGNDSCDEYPFASTAEGAFMKPPSEYSVNGDVDRYDNSRAGNGLGVFYNNMRVLMPDWFVVKVIR